MNKRKSAKEVSKGADFLSRFPAQVLSVGHVELSPHQWLVPKSTSLFWSIYIPDNKGLVLGFGKSATSIPAASIGLVPPGASAARDNAESTGVTFLHFDVGGYAGIELGNQLDKIVVVSPGKYLAQIAAIKESEDALSLRLYAEVLLAGVLVEALSATKKTLKRTGDDHSLQQILPALHALEERLSAPTYTPLKIEDMAKLCRLKPIEFSRTFFEALGKNPAAYAQHRRIAVAVQQLLFTNKSIDDISTSLSFANRFYFSRVFKEEVGDTPAAYRSVY